MSVQTSSVQLVCRMSPEEVLNCQMFLSYLKRAAQVKNGMPIWVSDEARLKAQANPQIMEMVRTPIAEALKYLSDKLQIRYQIVFNDNLVTLRDIAYVIDLAERVLWNPPSTT